MKTFKVTLEVEIDDDIADKYPNYPLNYDSPRHFVETLINDLATTGGGDFGYRVNCSSLKEVK